MICRSDLPQNLVSTLEQLLLQSRVTHLEPNDLGRGGGPTVDDGLVQRLSAQIPFLQLAGRLFKFPSRLRMEHHARRKSNGQRIAAFAYVEATKALGRSRWFGMGPNMSFELAQAYKRILTADFVREWWSNRVRDQITEMRFEYAWLSDGKSTATLGTENRVEWWTFAGTCGNATLAAALQPHLGVDVKSDAFKLSVGLPKTLTEVEAAIRALQGCDWDSVRPSVSDAAIDGLKFSECLPRPLARRVMEDRLRDPVAATFIASQPVSVLTM